MSISSPDEALRNLALLYLALAHGADDYLSDSELRTVIHQIERRFPDLVADTHSAQEVVMEALSVYADAEEPLTLLSDAMAALRDSISLEDRARFLDDLSHVARADGVVLRDERVVADGARRFRARRETETGRGASRRTGADG